MPILRVHACTMHFTVSADDTYSIHFVKRVKVVHIVDIHNQQYSVPINSCVEFGVVYDSKNSGKGTEDLSGTLIMCVITCYTLHRQIYIDTEVSSTLMIPYLKKPTPVYHYVYVDCPR